MGYQASLHYLYKLQKLGIKFGLSSISKLLAELGNPHHQYHCIHIAGTNGKGSTAAFIAAILSEAGYKTGLYTSPHLINFTERIKINNQCITPQTVTRLIKHIRDCITTLGPITFFEFVTAMAFMYFAEQKVDCAVVETGMGGRLDATNVIEPLVSIITNISRDHERYLGHTLSSIANEKAGIIKPNGVLLTAVRQPVLRSILKMKCKQLNASMFVLGRDFSIHRHTHTTLIYRGMRRTISNLRLGLLGDHQLDNAALALAATEIASENGFILPDKSVRFGMANVYWPGRLEIVKRNPLIVLDGAHNLAAMRTLINALSTLFKYDRLIFVVGIMSDKNIHAMLKEIASVATIIILCRPRVDRAAPTPLLAARLRRYRINYLEIQSVAEAVGQALAQCGRHDLLCITGSLFTVGEAKEALRPQASLC